jgi:hypothetical protein
MSPVFARHQGDGTAHFLASDLEPDINRGRDDQRGVGDLAGGKLTSPIGDTQEIITACLEQIRWGDVELYGGSKSPVTSGSSLMTIPSIASWTVLGSESWGLFVIITFLNLIHDLMNLFLFPVWTKPTPKTNDPDCMHNHANAPPEERSLEPKKLRRCLDIDKK